MTTDLVAQFTKTFSAGTVINVDFTQPTDCFNVTTLYGPSGCGKTTLLRCLAGLTHPDQGVIKFGEKTWFDDRTGVALLPQQRDIGLLFQEYALFPHLSVSDNIGFGLQDSKKGNRHQRVAEMLTLFGLQGMERRFPRELSGGQQQRVALARTLARRPKLLLLDEPLSALDAMLREQLRGELRRVISALKIPVILVTHDRIEAISLSDRVAVMDLGTIQQIGTVEEVFGRPKNAALARLVGVETVVLGEIVKVHEGLATVRVGETSLVAVAPRDSSQFVHVCIKGEDVALQRTNPEFSSVRNHLSATIRSIRREGPLVRVGLDCGFGLTSLITRPACDELQLATGQPISALVKAPAIHLIPHV